MNTTRTSAPAVSRALRAAGLNPQASGSRREGIYVVGMGDGTVNVRIWIDTPGLARRMAASVVEAATDAGYIATTHEVDGVPVRVGITGRAA